MAIDSLAADLPLPRTGADLRRLRVARGVSVADLARTLGCWRSYVSHCEGQAVLSDRVASRFVEALAATEPNVVRLRDLSEPQRRAVLAVLTLVGDPYPPLT